MNIFRKLDKSSKILVIVSLVGILVSVIALYSSYFMEEESQGDRVALATITVSRSDTRLKRSGNIHWYQVDKKLDCFQDDIVFTGEDSTATVEFPNGNKIYLLPHSLVSISDRKVTLENGVIEVDLKGEEAFGIESFGKVVKVTEKTKFRIVQTEKERKIVSITGKAAPTLKQMAVPEIKKPKDEFDILSPRTGYIAPNFKNATIKVSWRYGGTDQNFDVEVGDKKYKTKNSSLNVSLKELGTGKVTWRVRTPANEVKESYFEITDNIGIKLTVPSNDHIFALKEAESHTIDFGWTNPIGFSQILQVARDDSFENLVVSEELEVTSFQYKLLEGVYYWRVGYMHGGTIPYYSEVNKFNVVKEINPILAIKEVPESWDFAITPSMPLELESSHELENSRYLLEGPKRFKGQINDNEFEVKALPDGDYKLQVIGSFKGKDVRSPIYQFSVRNSKPAAPPKIKKAKVKLFVKVINSVLDLVFPSAHAADIVYPLNWEGEKGATYEIEIRGSDKKKVVLKEELSESSFDFNIENLGVYFWRVRSKKENGLWGKFSDYAEINVADKVDLVKQPLMIKAETEGEKITFYWKEPFPKFDYVLEIYKKGSSSPIKSTEVKGGKETLKRPVESEKLFWRVLAISPFGNKSVNRKKFLIPMEKRDLSFVEKPVTKSTQFIFRAGYFSTSSSYEQKLTNDSVGSSDYTENLSGSSYIIRGEAWFAKYAYKYGLHLSYRSHSLVMDDDHLNEHEFIAEFGNRIKRSSVSSQTLFFGIYNSLVESKLSDIEGKYVKTLASVRYQYQHFLSRKFSYTLDGTYLQSLKFDLGSPSFRGSAAINWHLTPRWWLSLQGAKEMNKLSRENESGVDGKLDTSSNITTYGLMINWQTL